MTQSSESHNLDKINSPSKVNSHVAMFSKTNRDTGVPKLTIQPTGVTSTMVFLLTLSACARVTVLICLSVCVCHLRLWRQR